MLPLILLVPIFKLSHYPADGSRSEAFQAGKNADSNSRCPVNAVAGGGSADGMPPD
jgi:hypothetical protein